MQSSTAQHEASWMVTGATAHCLRAVLMTPLLLGAFVLNLAFATPASAQSAQTAIPPPDRRPSRELTIPYHPRRPAPVNPAYAPRPGPEPRMWVVPPGGSASRTPSPQSPYRARLPVSR